MSTKMRTLLEVVKKQKGWDLPPVVPIMVRFIQCGSRAVTSRILVRPDGLFKLPPEETDDDN